MDKLFEQLKEVAKEGYPDAQYNLGCQYYDEGNYPEAVKWWRLSAEQGVSFAQNNLANCYAEGIAVERDFTEAAKWYSKAAEQGLANAQYALGNSYYEGRGVKKDYNKAKELWGKAAWQGLADAQFNLGTCYYSESNFADAELWWRKAVEGGNEDARRALDKLTGK